MYIGFKIRKIRELKNFSQENMAHELNMTQNGYGKIERNEVNLKFNTLLKISEILETPVETIIGYDDKTIFNNFPSKSKQQVNILHTAYDFNIQSLYEDKIKLLEDKIKLLEDKIMYLQEKLNKSITP